MLVISNTSNSSDIRDFSASNRTVQKKRSLQQPLIADGHRRSFNSRALAVSSLEVRYYGMKDGLEIFSTGPRLLAVLATRLAALKSRLQDYTVLSFALLLQGSLARQVKCTFKSVPGTFSEHFLVWPHETAITRVRKHCPPLSLGFRGGGSPNTIS